MKTKVLDCLHISLVLFTNAIYQLLKLHILPSIPRKNIFMQNSLRKRVDKHHTNSFQVKGYDCVTVCVTVCATVCATVGATVGAAVVTVVVVEAVVDTDSCWLALICPFFCAIWA